MKIETNARAAINPRARAARTLLVYFAVTRGTVQYSGTSCVRTHLRTIVPARTQLRTRDIDLQLYCTFCYGKIN